jgi:hypothetical protein
MVRGNIVAKQICNPRHFDLGGLRTDGKSWRLAVPASKYDSAHAIGGWRYVRGVPDSASHRFRGMGDVYLAKHPRLPRHDAIKVLRADISADADYRAASNGKPTSPRRSGTLISLGYTTAARLTASCGSQWMQLMGESIDGRADQYSLAATHTIY